MTSTRDPNLMTADERDREVASLFALAFVRMGARPVLGESPKSGSPLVSQHHCTSAQLQRRPQVRAIVRAALTWLVVRTYGSRATLMGHEGFMVAATIVRPTGYA